MVVGLAALVVVVAVVVWAVARSSGSGDPAATPAATTASTGATPDPGSATTGSGSSTSPAGPPPSADPAPTQAAAPSVPARSGERPAVAPGAASTATGGPTVRLSNVGHVAGVAAGPGDIAGPAIRVSIVIENTGTSDLALNLTAVNAYLGADRQPAGSVTQPGGSPFSGTLKPGQSATGVYLFTVPTADRQDVTVVVDYLPGQPAAVFAGAF